MTILVQELQKSRFSKNNRLISKIIEGVHKLISLINLFTKENLFIKGTKSRKNQFRKRDLMIRSIN